MTQQRTDLRAATIKRTSRRYVEPYYQSRIEQYDPRSKKWRMVRESGACWDTREKAMSYAKEMLENQPVKSDSEATK